MTTPSTKGELSEIGTYGASRFEITRDGRRCAVFDKIEDARMFRAAPDLLAALEAIIDGPDDDYTLAVQKARAAIAKARGEA